MVPSRAGSTLGGRSVGPLGQDSSGGCGRCARGSRGGSAPSTGTILCVRCLVIVVAASVAATGAAVVGGASAGAQVTAVVVVAPATADPGGAVTVSNGPLSPCPPGNARNPSASVDLFAAGSATPVNRVPYQGVVTPAGTWTVDVRLAPDVPPGTYRVQAGCYSDSGLNSGFGPTYEPGRLDLRLQQPGQPALSVRRTRPGDSIQVGSGDSRCTPPAGSPSPRVRVSLLDSARATRAEAEGPVDIASGRWSVSLRVPDIGPQNVEINAVCLARVAAPAPYARYRGTALSVDRAQAPETSTTVPATTTPPSTGAPGVPTTAPATPPTTANAASLPTTPVAVAIVAEPTYTG